MRISLLHKLPHVASAPKKGAIVVRVHIPCGNRGDARVIGVSAYTRLYIEAARTDVQKIFPIRA